MVSLNINTIEIAIILSILLRLSIIFFMLPAFSSSQLPANIKACLIMALTFMLLPFIRQNVQPIPLEAAALSTIVIGEFVFGIVFSLAMLIITGAFQFAGELVSFEMGFGFAQVADPQTGTQSTVLSVWAELLATMIFFALNGHLIVLRLIIESFKTIPVGGFIVDAALFQKIMILSGMLFIFAIKLAAPIIAVLILTHLALGLMSKFAPQVNLLATSFPITIAIGVLFLGLTVIIWGDMTRKILADIFHFLANVSQ